MKFDLKSFMQDFNLDFFARGLYRYNFRRLTDGTYVCDCDWVYGYPAYFKNPDRRDEEQWLIIDEYLHSLNGCYFNKCSAFVVKPNSICRFTGKFDKSENPIFENDVIDYDLQPFGPEPYVFSGTVEYISGRWVIAGNVDQNETPKRLCHELYQTPDHQLYVRTNIYSDLIGKGVTY